MNEVKLATSLFSQNNLLSADISHHKAESLNPMNEMNNIYKYIRMNSRLLKTIDIWLAGRQMPEENDITNYDVVIYQTKTIQFHSATSYTLHVASMHLPNGTVRRQMAHCFRLSYVLYTYTIQAIHSIYVWMNLLSARYRFHLVLIRNMNLNSNIRSTFFTVPWQHEHW